MQVDAFLLANAAEAREGLLFVLGGGWTRCWPDTGQSFPLRRALSVVVSIRVEYQETNIDHSFQVECVDSDERPLNAAIEGTFTLGRDANLTPGMSQLVQFAGTLAIDLPQPGIYALTLRLDGEQRRRVQFEALPARP